MSEIVERLRALRFSSLPDRLREDAAVAIEQRDAEIERLQAALLEVETGHTGNYRTIAHNALNPKAQKPQDGTLL